MRRLRSKLGEVALVAGSQTILAPATMYCVSVASTPVVTASYVVVLRTRPRRSKSPGASVTGFPIGKVKRATRDAVLMPVNAYDSLRSVY